MSDLEERHIADLHALAAELGVPRYRLLPRGELVAELASRQGSAGERPQRRRERSKNGGERPARPRRGRERLRSEPEDRQGDAEAATVQVTGVLEITPQRYGFIRLQGPEAGDGDVYISASQVKRCELKSGDEVTGPAREPRRGERHRALVHVDLVNGQEPTATAPSGAEPSDADSSDADSSEAQGADFDALTPVVATRRVRLDDDRDDVLLRAVDLLAPLALGQRVLVSAAPRSGRTTLLRGLAKALAAATDPELIVLLIDERPEEVTGWREVAQGDNLVAASAELAPADQVTAAEQALQRARRSAAAGADVVLLVDSLSRLAFAADGVTEVKRLFGSARDLAEEASGSLTVIATVLKAGEDGGAAERAVATTESSRITLDPELASAGIVPALDATGCRVSNEDQIREPDELAAARRLRVVLADFPAREAANLLRDRIEDSASNADLLAGL